MESNWLDFNLVRGPIRGEGKSKIGLVLKIKARPELEEFMRTLSQGNRALADPEMGEAWFNCDPSGVGLEYYAVNLTASKYYTLANVGESLLVTPDRNRQLITMHNEELVNLSFLRLVGASNPEGLAIGLAGAYSAEYVMKLRQLLPQALKMFLHDYLVPMTINLHIMNG